MREETWRIRLAFGALWLVSLLGSQAMGQLVGDMAGCLVYVVLACVHWTAPLAFVLWALEALHTRRNAKRAS